jgi:hypothetical protein
MAAPLSVISARGRPRFMKACASPCTRLGYGHAGEKQGGDAIKELIGDALRNAAMRFGAALDLWHKGDLHAVDTEPPDVAAQRTQWLGEQLAAVEAASNVGELKRAVEAARASELADDESMSRIDAAAASKASKARKPNAAEAAA